MAKNNGNPIIAAVDLGSNSFHLTLAQLQHNNLQIIGRLKEKVRLAAGLDKNNILTEESQQRAFNCLEQFKQRLGDSDTAYVRAVGTYALRKAKNTPEFLLKAEAILGYPIEVISGREEARLIFEGVAHFQLTNRKQMVVDIGGGSTEFAIGEAFEPVLLDSLQMGCVSYSQKFFNDGLVSKSNFKRAITAARLELLSIQDLYLREGWEITVGTSGTIESILDIYQATNSEKSDITLNDLLTLKKRLIDTKNIADINLEGLSETRREILPAGLAILIAIFKTLKIESMSTSPAALREGLLYELVGQEKTADIKERAVRGLLARYHIDMDQARRVNTIALLLWNKVAKPWDLDNDYFKYMLSWAARCHEIGLSINFSKQQKHGEYIIKNSDLSGFSIMQQRLLALLVRSFRRKFPLHRFEVISDDKFRTQLIRLGRILRLAVLFNHRRRDVAWPEIEVAVDNEEMTLVFPAQYLSEHSLLAADLEQEQAYLSQVNLPLLFLEHQ